MTPGPDVPASSYLTNGKKMLIRQPGDDFKRASALIDLEKDHFTQIQHHNHSYTEVGKLADWPKLMELPARPAPRSPEPPKVTLLEDKKDILGHATTCILVESMGEKMKILGTAGLPAFYQWFAFCPEPMPSFRLEEQIGAICRQQNVFPLLITLTRGGQEKAIFEVTKITPAKPGDQNDPSLDDKTYTIPADHRLMRHPMQEFKRMEEERSKTQSAQPAEPPTLQH